MVSNRRLPKASDIVVDALRQRILTEKLPPGHRLPSETELHEEFGLGRATVREGLRLLEREGLIEIKRGPGGGISVMHPDISQVSDAVSVLFAVRGVTLREFLEFRQMVEPATARSAARRATPEQREAVMAAAASEHQLSTVADVHVLIAQAGGNGVVATMLQALHTPFLAHFRVPKIGTEDIAATGRAHLRIATAIRDRDEDAAYEAMAVHLTAYASYLERTDLIDEPIVAGSTWAPSR